MNRCFTATVVLIVQLIAATGYLFGDPNCKCCDAERGCEGCAGLVPELTGFRDKVWASFPDYNIVYSCRDLAGAYNCEEEDLVCYDGPINFYSKAGCNAADLISNGDIEMFLPQCETATSDPCG